MPRFSHSTAAPFDPARAARTFEALGGTRLCPAPTDSRRCWKAVFGNSAFLGRLALREPGALARLFRRRTGDALLDAASALALAAARCRAKPRRWRSCAPPSAAPRWPSRWPTSRAVGTLEEVTGALTRFADACVQGALALSAGAQAAQQRLAEQRRRDAGSDHRPHRARNGQIRRPSSSIIPATSTWSSFTTRDAFPFASAAIRAARRSISCAGLVKLLAETTADGYVFRVDLRLRPDAGATQVAISTDAALDLLRRPWARTGSAPP